MKHDERREHRRTPILTELAEPVSLYVVDEPHWDAPAVLTDLSAKGMGLVVMAHITGKTEVQMTINLPGLEGVSVAGKIVWISSKGDTTRIGVSFSKISSSYASRINHMAEANGECDTKLSFGVKDVCFRECHFWPLCDKPVKLKVA
jgi:hypothetical protein